MAEVRSGLPVRRSGRVLLVNRERELLLFRADERLRDGRYREFWFPVGGGVELEESYADCAARELFEETGLRIDPERLGPVVAVRGGAFVLDGAGTWSDEAFFFLQVDSWDVDVSGFTELERRTVTTHRWWSLPELAETDRVVFPLASELVTLVGSILESGPPVEPVLLSWANHPDSPQIWTTAPPD